jgi:hypothetical protein
VATFITNQAPNGTGLDSTRYSIDASSWHSDLSLPMPGKTSAE